MFASVNGSWFHAEFDRATDRRLVSKRLPGRLSVIGAGALETFNRAVEDGSSRKWCEHNGLITTNRGAIDGHCLQWPATGGRLIQTASTPDSARLELECGEKGPCPVAAWRLAPKSRTSSRTCGPCACNHRYSFPPFWPFGR
jgi:hypothetical protein